MTRVFTEGKPNNSLLLLKSCSPEYFAAREKTASSSMFAKSSYNGKHTIPLKGLTVKHLYIQNMSSKHHLVRTVCHC